MGRLDGKVAFITGAGSGIARAASLLFTQEGAKVVIAELKPELGQAAEKMVRDAGGDAARFVSGRQPESELHKPKNFRKPFAAFSEINDHHEKLPS